MNLQQLDAEAARRGVIVVKPETLAKYGGTRRAWLAMLAAQGWKCPVCERMPKTGRFVTDHEHVKGWKLMQPAQRWKFVRGITCWSCNRYLLARDINVRSARNVLTYLERYQRRRPLV